MTVIWCRAGPRANRLPTNPTRIDDAVAAPWAQRVAAQSLRHAASARSHLTATWSQSCASSSKVDRSSGSVSSRAARRSFDARRRHSPGLSISASNGSGTAVLCRDIDVNDWIE